MSTEEGIQLRAEEPKIGLALSGGGFRASFFHIGVLAQLARLGLLHRVEVISTVSGGSIIGALYYLHVRNLLASKPDANIKDSDYVEIVQCIERDFLEGVQRNLRMMTYCDWKKNWHMASADYSRSDRLGELYDEYFYRPVMNPSPAGMVQMQEIKIWPPKPDGAPDFAFSLPEGNAGRRAKVPMLLVNATALNNGHDWRFEASTMGEPRGDDAMSLNIDKSARLRRPPAYPRMISRQQSVELGLAVAASACVPGIFNPLAISGLYPYIRVELVDGGVHDNQGIQALIDVENCCDLLIVSDGSGQMRDEDEPRTWLAAVLNRSQEIFMKRVREEQLRRVMREWDGRIAFFHLRQGIAPRFVPWYTEEERLAENAGCELPSECESFGVSSEVQDLLSKIRTDLDSFTEVEAYSLMLDGYLVSGYSLSQTEAFMQLARPPHELPPEDWQFMAIRPWLERPTPFYLEQLRAAQSQFFKLFKLNTPLAVCAVALALIFGWWLIFKSPLAHLRISIQSILIGALFVAAAALMPQLSRTFRVLKFLRDPTHRLFATLGQGVLPLLEMFLVKFHLKFIDPLFIRTGRLKNLGPHGDSRGDKH